MKTTNGFLVGLVLSAVLTVCNAPVDAAGSVVPSYADQAWALVQQQRVANGLPPLVRLQSCELAASLHSLDMANRNYLSHYTAPTVNGGPVYPAMYRYWIGFYPGDGPAERLEACHYYDVGYWGENAGSNEGWGFQSPSAQVDGWMGSPPHRANILNPDFKAAGIGCGLTSTGVFYYTLTLVEISGGYATIGSNFNLW